MLTYREQPPPAVLSRYVECIWSIQTTHAVPGHRVPPDGCLDILFDSRNGLRLIGAMTEQQLIDLPPGALLSGIRFRPGMARLFIGLPPLDVTDQAISFDMGDASPLDEAGPRLAEAMQSFSQTLQPLAQPLNPVQRAIEALTAAHGDLSLEYCARQANLSPRQFRRRCEEESGLTPKLLCRILRFRYACQLARSAERKLTWPLLAAEAAYFDQAHLIRDFRQFTNATPMTVFSNTRPAEPNKLEA